MSQVPRKIALIFGGESSEHDVSVLSATEVAKALDSLEDVRTAPVYISKQGQWHWARRGEQSDTAKLIAAVNDTESFARHYGSARLQFPQALLHLSVDENYSNLLILHGPNGEDGRLQGALELADLPYTGSASAASALAMDKPRCQAYLISRGFAAPPFVRLDLKTSCMGDMHREVTEQLGFPCVIKPALAGSSVGVSAAGDEQQLAEALAGAFKWGPVAHAEKFVQGREFTCGVLDREKPTALPVTEIIPPEGRLFDYEAKYVAGVSEEVTPARIDAALTEQIQTLAVGVHQAVGCEGFSRVDFIQDSQDSDEIKILEINTIPGMTETSLLPQGARAAGIEFPQLLDLIIEHSRERWKAARPGQNEAS